MSTLTASPAWLALQSHCQTMAHAGITQLFEADPQRVEHFSLRVGEMLLDYSKNIVNRDSMHMLAALARERGLGARVHALFNGERVNVTEDRPALHTALRGTQSVLVDGADIMPQIQATLNRMQAFSDDVRGGRITGSNGRPFTDVIHLGIGGSHLGPLLASRALAPYAAGGPRVHFVSNIDVAALQRVMAPLDPLTTLVIVASKSFSTVETVANARQVRDWQMRAIGDSVARHFLAITANTELAARFGIVEDRIFPFWDWVGGRYSLWSAVGLPVALACGMPAFRDLLRGAHDMDEHFRNAAFERSMPVVLAMLGIWYNNFFGAASHAVVPYDESLALLPAYLQQLDMESSGKRVGEDGEPVEYDTGMIIWGAAGTDAQHSFFQLLHQGTRLVPADFIAVCQPQHSVEEHHAILMANFFAQAAALMTGAPVASHAHERFPGNRPSNALLLGRLAPHSLGMLLALYEHKVFVQNVIWGINPFDQPGVELGKRLANRILPDLDGREPTTGYDASTNSLIDFYKANRDSNYRDGGPQ